MNVLVLGAGGETGRLVVRQAVADGHIVTAFVHDAAEFHETGARIVQGDAMDSADLTTAMAGQDAVIDALGGGTPWRNDRLETNSARNVVEVMRSQGVRRLIVVSAMGVAESKANVPWLYEHLVMDTLLHGVMKDKAGMEAVVDTSGLEWTLVRPAHLVNDGPSGRPIKPYGPGDTGSAHKISRTDLARFLVDQLSSSTYRQQAVSIATE